MFIRLINEEIFCLKGGYHLKRIVHYILRAFCIVIGFALFLSTPFLFGEHEGAFIFDSKAFTTVFANKLNELTHFYKTDFFMGWMKTDMLQNYLYSMKLFLASTALTLGVGFFIAAIVIMSPAKIRRKLRSVINFSEAVPDLLVIFALQILVITIYKNTGIKLFQLYGFTGNPYFIPIVIISFLPTFFLAQFLINAFGEEMEKDYAIFAKAKGLAFTKIYLIHMLRNIFPMFIVQLRTLIWVILSNLFLVEYLFSLRAYTSHIGNLGTLSSVEAVLDIILFTIPIILIELVIGVLSIRSRGKEEAL